VPAPDAAALASDAARDHLRWALVSGVGPILFSRIVAAFGSARASLDAAPRELAAIRGISRESADAIVAALRSAPVEPELEATAAIGARILCREDADYPRGLLRIPDPPVVLYVKGELRPDDALAVAIVGSRRCSMYGAEQARRFGDLLAAAGFTVVSGLARGIDAFAHHGALDAGGRSIAVFGNGLQTIFPEENRPLAERMLTRGAWVSELPISTTVRANNFPKRNRIIAGMSLGTLVIEAASRSGALITARLATEYNREVFAIPGRLLEPSAIGTNALIRDGAAKLVTDLKDILDELGDVGRKMADLPARAEATTPESDEAADARAALPLNETERAVYAAIGHEPVLQDVVLRTVPLPAGMVLGAVTSLELKRLVSRLPGNLVVRAGRT